MFIKETTDLNPNKRIRVTKFGIVGTKINNSKFLLQNVLTIIEAYVAAMTRTYN